VSRAGGARLNHIRRGVGSPLLLIHSLGGSLIQWKPVMDLLAAEHDVVAVDMPGFGDSAPLPDGIEPTAANLASAVLGFAGSLGLEGKPAVAGISLGGWTAVECARQDGARAVVAICPAGFWREAPGGATEALNRARAAGRRIAPFLGALALTAGGRRRMLGRSFQYPERLSPGDAAAVARAYVNAPAYPRASQLMRTSRVEHLEQVKAPITIAWAEHDRLVRNRPLKAGILPKRVKQVELPGCGHVPTWDDPELVARVVLEGSARKR
jgi:pimeloyl-ACP methyl ester carboxylesterase